MRKHLLFLFIALLGVSTLQANPVDIAKAQRLALSFAKHHQGLSKSADEAVLSYTLRSTNGMATMYAFNVGNGFVIVAADDCARPVLAYSDESAFDYENGPENMKWFLGEISEGIAMAVQSGTRASADVAMQWKQLENYGTTSRGSNVPVVGPLIQTKWNQEPLYNRYCPTGTPTGCVATAMAQIMKYWNYPAQGTGSHSYMHPVYGQQSANFGQTTYNWDIMPISLGNQSTEEEIDAVAILSYHCGVAVDMDYATDGSGAQSGEVPGDMAAYFSYAPEARFVDKGGTTTRAWEDLLRTNLDQNMPLYYSGYSAGGGHAFICDGYDVDNLFHFNWGWGGASNGYYVIDGDDFEYSSGQGIILDLVPSDMYSAMPAAPEALTISIENDESLYGTLSWVNPTTTVSGATVSAFDKVIVRRNGFVIYEEENVAAGAAMTYTDKVPYFDQFEYSVCLVYGGMDGRLVYETASFGPYCQWKVVLSGGDFQGWNGGGISVRNGAGTETAFVTMTSSSVAVQTINIALGRNSFVWVEPESPVTKVAFSIKDSEGNVVFNYNGSSSLLEPGEIVNINNGCGNDNVGSVPYNLKAVAQEDDNTNILLTWESDNAPEFGYCIYRDGFIFQMSSEPSFLDENTSIGGHCYQVSAMCNGGETELSNEYCANSGSGCEPARNLYLTLQNSGKPFIHWEAPEGSEPNGYLIYRRAEDEVYRLIKPTTALEYKDNSNLAEGKKYYYAVTANYTDIQCTSAYAAALHNPDEFFVVYNKTTVPDGLVAMDNVEKVQLAWNYLYQAESYKLYRDGALLAENLTENTYLDENVTLDVAYCYKVTAMLAGEETEPTNEVCVTVVGEPVLPCSAPTDLRGNMQNNIIHVEWTAPTDRTPDSYALTITDNASGSVVTETLTETHFDFTPTTEAIDYKFQVKAVYAECESDFALTATGDDFINFSNFGVDDLSLNCQIYPNPTNGIVRIEAKDMKSVVVANLVGQQVLVVSCEGDEMNLDLSQQQEGIYFVRIVTANGETTQRVSVMK